MSTEPFKPWTFEQFEVYQDQTWEILDPNMAARIAIFFDQAEAEAYLAWRNKKQAKREAKKQAKRVREHNAAIAANLSRQIDVWPSS